MQELTIYENLLLVLGLMASAILSKIAISLNKNSLSIRYLNLYYTFQFFVTIIFLNTLPEFKAISEKGMTHYIKEAIPLTIVVYLSFQCMSILAGFIIKLLFPRAAKYPDLVSLIKMKPLLLQAVSLFFASVFLLYPFTSIGAGIGYAVAILFNYGQFMPFIAGVTFKWRSPISIFWLISLSVLFVLGMISGSRGTAMLGAICFGLGLFYSLEKKTLKRLYVVTVIALIIPAMTLVAFVGQFRHVIGRVSFEKINLEYIQKAVATYQKIQERKRDFDISSGEGAEQGIGRFVNVVNPTIFITVPLHYQYTGLKGIDKDFKYVFNLAFISGTTTKDLKHDDALNFRLNKYGFRITESNSVEYSVITDGWIRFGFKGVLLFGFLFSFAILTIENLIRSFWKTIPSFTIIALLCTSLSSFYSYAYSIWPNIRMSILGISYAIFIFSIIYFIYTLIFKNKIIYKFL